MYACTCVPGACVRVCACLCLGTCAAWGLGRVCTSMCVRASRVAVRVHVCVHMRACARAGSPRHTVTHALGTSEAGKDRGGSDADEIRITTQ